MACQLGSMEFDSEHTVRYWLFPHDSKGNLVNTKEELEKLSIEYLAFLASYQESYIWNLDPFSLNVAMTSSSEEESGDLSPHISGVMIIDEGIEDCWFIVYLLQQLTKSFRGLVCRIIDTDGEFLLIEAADFLPTWAEDPDTTEQRVYLKNGKVHLVPPSVCSSNPTPVMESVSKVQKRPSSTLASPNINKAIDHRTNGYPKKISDDQHLAHAYLPVGVAALLREYPTLVAASVRSFCRRDQMDNKVLRVMKHFPPEQRVLSAVRFPKALYAQCSAHPYQADRRTGWSLPPPDHPSYASHILGMKLACGFEILVSGAGGLTPTTPNGPTFESIVDVKDNSKWLNYKKSLVTNGYFRGELEGSKLYQELEGNAQRFFVSNMLTGNRGDSSEDDLSIGAVIVKLLSKINIDYEYFKKLEQQLTPPDDENWLTITEDDLDSALKSRYGVPAPAKGSNEKQMMDSLNSFMKHMSDLNDVEIPPELRDATRKVSSTFEVAPTTDGVERKLRKSSRKVSAASGHVDRKVSSQSNASDVSNMSSFSNKIDRNSEAFTDMFQNILSLEVPEDRYFRDSDDSSGMSGYDSDDKDISLSRKTSDGSRTSSGIDSDMKAYMRQLEEELHTGRSEDRSPPLAGLEDEFDDVEDFQSVSVDLKSVQDLVKAFKQQAGSPGPASTLIGAMGLKPSK